MDSILLLNVGQIVGFLALLRYMHVQLRDTRIGLEGHIKASYTKDEVDKLIDLKQLPLEVRLEHIQSDVKDIKEMVGALASEK